MLMAGLIAYRQIMAKLPLQGRTFDVFVRVLDRIFETPSFDAYHPGL